MPSKKRWPCAGQRFFSSSRKRVYDMRSLAFAVGSVKEQEVPASIGGLIISTEQEIRQMYDFYTIDIS